MREAVTPQVDGSAEEHDGGGRQHARPQQVADERPPAAVRGCVILHPALQTAVDHLGGEKEDDNCKDDAEHLGFCSGQEPAAQERPGSTPSTTGMARPGSRSRG